MQKRGTNPTHTNSIRYTIMKNATTTTATTEKFYAVAQAGHAILGTGKGSPEAAYEDWSGWSDAQDLIPFEDLPTRPRTSDGVYIAECTRELYDSAMSGDVNHFAFDYLQDRIVYSK